jgi:hypothetical protein
MAEHHASILEQAGIVGTAMGLGRGHPLDGAPVGGGGVTAGAKDSCYAAHRMSHIA